MVYPTWAVGLAGFVVAVIVLLGIVGNIFVIAIIFNTKKLKGKGHALIANLAVADTLQAVNLIFMLVAIANGGTWILNEAACQAHAYMTVEFVLASMLTLCAVSVNRYFLIVRPKQYDTFFRPKIMRLIVALIWLLPQVFAILPIVGWSRFVFQPGKSLCLFKFSFSKSYAFTLVSTITTLPLIVILVAYYKIFRTVGEHVDRTKATLKQGNTTASVDEIQITRTLAVVIGSYVVCFLPATVINFVEMFKPDWEIPVWLDLSSMVLVMANHANNPAIYGLMNRQYRVAFIRLARRLFVGRGRSQDAVSSHYSTSQCSTAQEEPVTMTTGGRLKLDMPDTNEISVIAPGNSTFTPIKV